MYSNSLHVLKLMHIFMIRPCLLHAYISPLDCMTHILLMISVTIELHLCGMIYSYCEIHLKVLDGFLPKISYIPDIFFQLWYGTLHPVDESTNDVMM